MRRDRQVAGRFAAIYLDLGPLSGANLQDIPYLHLHLFNETGFHAMIDSFEKSSFQIII